MIDFLFWISSSILLFYYLHKFYNEFLIHISFYVLDVAKRRGEIITKTKEYTIYKVDIFGITCKIKEPNKK
jgi:hypothetical protein